MSNMFHLIHTVVIYSKRKELFVPYRNQYVKQQTTFYLPMILKKKFESIPKARIYELIFLA